MAGVDKEDLSFVKAPPEEIDIDCPICLQVMLDDPHLVTCCGHHFCSSCIRRVKDTGGPCPYCKEEEFQVFPDKSRLRYINGLQVNCSNKGCQWKGDLKDLPLHINKGKRNGECLFEMVKCKYERCNVTKGRKGLLLHEKSFCRQRLHKCEYCHLVDTYSFITEIHYRNCTQYPILCPNMCQTGKMYPRGNIKDHLSKECILQLVECEFKWAGCHYSPLRKNVSQHNIESQLNHMSLIAKACGELKRENEELKKENHCIKQDLHRVFVGEDIPILPLILKIDTNEHRFFSSACGHFMSVEYTNYNCVPESGNLTFKVYKKIFSHVRLLVSNIVFKSGRETVTITRDNCSSYKDMFDEEDKETDVIQEFVFNYPFLFGLKIEIIDAF